MSRTGYILRSSRSRPSQVSLLQLTATPGPTGSSERLARLVDGRLAPPYTGQVSPDGPWAQEWRYTAGGAQIDTMALLGLTYPDGAPLLLPDGQITFSSSASAEAGWPALSPMYPVQGDGRGSYFSLLEAPVAEAEHTRVRFHAPADTEFCAGEWMVGLREQILPAQGLTYEAITPMVKNGDRIEQVGAPFDRIRVDFVPSTLPVELPTETVLWWPTGEPEEAYLGRFEHPYSVRRTLNGTFLVSAVFEEARRPFYV